MSMRKVRLGQDYRFQWSPARLMTVPTSATAVVVWPAGSQSYSLTIRGNDTVTAVSSDRRQITVTVGTSGALASLIDGNPMPAMLVNAATQEIPVLLTRVVSSGVYELADPLPLVAGAAGTIRWLTGSATIPLAHVPATPIRPVAWRVTYTPIINGGTGSVATEVGALAVVRDVFATGLVDGSLSVVAPWLRGTIAPSMAGLSTYILAGYDLLISLIRPRLPVGTWEDSLAGAQFHRAHALAAQICVCDDLAGRGVARTDLRAQLAADLKAELGGCFARIEWLDVNGDGLATANEGATRTAAPILSHVTNLTVMDYSADPTTPDVFDRVRVTGPM